jgi:hypothetical protein
MGWTADDDPLATIELSFPTLRAAVRYAERQRLPYVVQTTEEQSPGQLSARWNLCLDRDTNRCGASV